MKLLAFKGLAETELAFRESIVAVAERRGLDANALSAVMYFESGYDPSEVNKSSGATGVIQFMPSTAKILGTTVSALRGMSRVQQMPWVEKYFAKVDPKGTKIVSPLDTYLAVFWPSGMGKPPDHVIAEAGGIVYERNKGLDRNKDGVITVGDIGSMFGSVLASAHGKELPEDYTGAGYGENASEKHFSKGSVSGSGIGVLIAMLGGVLILRRKKG